MSPGRAFEGSARRLRPPPHHARSGVVARDGHLGGADEPGARRAEEDLWTRFVRDGVADQMTGLRYLLVLKKRPDDQLFASR
jgi:hypothetical protein